MLNLKIYAILGAIILGGGYFFKQYYDSAQKQILTLEQNQATIKAANDAQILRYNTFRNELAAQTATITQLNSDLSKIKTESTKLSKTLARHELDKLASAKPDTLKRLANRATKKVFAELESVSKPIKKTENEQ